MSRYRVVDFFHRSELKRTVWYGPEGPPSALTAIYNYCALTYMKFEVSQVPEYIKVEDLKEALEVFVNIIFAPLRNAEDYTVEELNAQQDRIKQQINSMNSSAVVLQPHPYRVDSFEKNSFTWIAQCLGIRLLHGWLCNSDEHPYICEGVTYDLLQRFLSSLSLSDLADPDVAKKCKFIKDFLKEEDKLCTSYGYFKLCEMPHGSFALYYWNKKLDVIHKNESYLLILETDQGVMDRLPGVTWRVFEEVDDGNSIYLTSDYSLVSNQPNIAKAQLWFKDKGLSKNKVYSIEPAAGKRSDCQEDKAAVTQDVQGDVEQLSAGQRKRRSKKLKKQAEEEARRKQGEEEEAGMKQGEEEEAGRKRAEEEEAGRKQADKAAGTQDVQGDVEQLSAGQRKRRNKNLKKQAEEEARRKQGEEEEARMKQGEEEEAGRKRAEEEEAGRKRAEEEEAGRKQAELEEAGRKQAELEEAGRKQAEEEEAGRKQAEEEERKKLSAICNDFEHFLLVYASVFISLIVSSSV